jgi:tetratricopeptide (TPR) repeat protein
MLGRIYTRLIGDPQQNQVNEEMLKRSIEQYQVITSKDPKDVESWVTLGRLYRVSRNSVQAEKAFRNALELEADNEDALTGLAMVYSDVGDMKSVVEALKKVVDKSPSLRTLVALANTYEQMRDYSNAAEVLKQALKLNEANPQIKRALAQNLLYSEKVDEALALYKQLASEDPKDAQVQLRLAEIYRQKHNLTEARTALNKARELDDDNIEISYEEVNLLETEGKYDQAITGLKKILADTSRAEYAPPERSNRAMFMERLGFLQRQAQQYQGAVDTFRSLGELGADYGPRSAVHIIDTWRIAKDFTKAQAEAEAAAQKYPNERMVTVVRANLLADLGKTSEAAQIIRSLLKGDGDREVYLTLAQIYEKGKQFGEMDKAIQQAEKLSKTRQEIEAIAFMRGAMLEKQKNYDAAEKEFRKVLESNPKNAGALNYLGYMFADRGVRLEEARTLISQALEIDPDNGAYLDSLGWVYYRLNNHEEAEKHLRRALEQTSGDPTVHDHLGDVYSAQGKLSDAIQQWQLSLREWERNPKADADPAEVEKVTKKLESARVRLARETGAAKQR